MAGCSPYIFDGDACNMCYQKQCTNTTEVGLPVGGQSEKIAAEMWKEFGLSGRSMNTRDFLALPSVKALIAAGAKKGSPFPFKRFKASAAGYPFFWDLHSPVHKGVHDVIKVVKDILPKYCPLSTK